MRRVPRSSRWAVALSCGAIACSAARPAPGPDGREAAQDAGRAGFAADGGAAAFGPADAGPPPDPALTLLTAARADRLRAEQELRAAAASPAVSLRNAASHAYTCGDEAHRSWMLGLATVVPAGPDAGPAGGALYAQVGQTGAEALYLEAVCGALWARTQGFTHLVARAADLRAALLRVEALAPGLDGAGPARELGALAASLPAFAGGDLAEARERLLKAIELAPADPRNRLVLARTVAVKAQDRELFVTQLETVREGPDKAAAAEAGELLARTDELFGPAEAAQKIPGGTGR